MPDSSKKHAIDQQIDANLRRIFEEDAHSELPDRLRDLARKLQGAGSSDDEGNEGGGPGGEAQGGGRSSGAKGSGGSDPSTSSMRPMRRETHFAAHPR